MFALASLKMAIHRYAKSLSHLTSIHYIFVKQCLLAKCFDDAIGILDIPIDDLDLGVSSIPSILTVIDAFDLQALSSILLLRLHDLHLPEKLSKRVRLCKNRISLVSTFGSLC